MRGRRRRASKVCDGERRRRGENESDRQRQREQERARARGSKVVAADNTDRMTMSFDCVKVFLFRFTEYGVLHSVRVPRRALVPVPVEYGLSDCEHPSSPSVLVRSKAFATNLICPSADANSCSQSTFCASLTCRACPQTPSLPVNCSRFSLSLVRPQDFDAALTARPAA